MSENNCEQHIAEPMRWIAMDFKLGYNSSNCMCCISFSGDETAGSIRNKSEVAFEDVPQLLAETLKDFMYLKRAEFSSMFKETS